MSYKINCYEHWDSNCAMFSVHHITGINEMDGSEESNIVGSAELYFIVGTDSKLYGYIESVFIHKNHRNKGLGKRLIKSMIDKSKEEDCYKIIATSRFERENVHKFYEDLGLKKWGYEFRMDL